MTDDELNRRIAKFMGYSVVKKRSSNKVYPWCYQLQFKGKAADRSTGFFGWGWHTDEKSAWFYLPNFSADPVMTIMLLEKMPTGTRISRCVGDFSITTPCEDGSGYWLTEEDDIQKAVALAFAKANNLMKGDE